MKNAVSVLPATPGDSLYHALADDQRHSELPSFWATLAAQPSDCVPAATVVTTIVNRAHAELLQIQHASLPPCFLRRYGAVCFEGADQHVNATCASWPVRALWSKGLSYGTMTWLKWEVLHLALTARGVRAALWASACESNPIAQLSHRRGWHWSCTGRL